jgi:uncharacterized protein YjbI with pentapeptide repeats
MGIRDFFSVGKDLINTFKDIVNYDTGIKNSITEAGGLISLVGISLELYEKYRDSKKSPEQKAFASLMSFVFQTTNELLKDVKEKEGREAKAKFESNWKLMQEDIFKPFEENSDWNDHLPDHQAVINFKKEVIQYLKAQGYETERIKEFSHTFNLELEGAIRDDRLKEFYKYSSIARQSKDIVKYLEQVESMKNFSLEIDRKPLSSYYVKDRDAILTNVDDTWGSTDEEVAQKYQSKIKNVNEIIKQELGRLGKSPLIIGASFGSGKSSLARMIASEYAANYLDNVESGASFTTGEYIPIFVPLKNGLRVEYENFSLDNLLNTVVAPKSNPGSNTREILLILDGLDEYNGIETLVNKLDTLYSEYRNLRLIITTRLVLELLTRQGINTASYIRLLQFNKQQLTKFYKNYTTIPSKDAIGIKYDDMPEIDFSIEEIAKPLFAWMFSQMYIDPQYRVEFKKGWNQNKKRSLIYFLFSHYITLGRHKATWPKGKWDELYIIEKRILRGIAAIQQIYGENLTLNEVTNFVSDSDLTKLTQVYAGRGSSRNFEDSLKEFLSSSYFYLQTKPGATLVSFIHKTLKEYLLAEFYVEALLENKAYKLNAGIPSEETIGFIDGLLGLLLDREDEIIDKFIVQDETSLLNSFHYGNGRNAIKTLEQNAKRSVEEESIIFNIKKGTKKENKEEKEDIWRQADISGKDYKGLWVKRWISLYVLNELKPAEELDKEKLRRLVRYSGHFTPGYLMNLKNVDLSSTYLSRADFSHADLSGANLSGASMKYANLSRCNLSRVRLKNTYLRYANLHRAILSRADLSGAYLRYANLRGADLTNSILWEAELPNAFLGNAILRGADLTKAELPNAFLGNAILRGADLTNAKLNGTILMKADLRYANIQGADLTGANLSYANLSYSLVIGCKKYQDLICTGANFSNAIFDDDQLVNHLRENKAVNLPVRAMTESELKQILEDRKLKGKISMFTKGEETAKGR